MVGGGCEVADGGGRWQLLATVVTWRRWVVFDDGDGCGGCGRLWLWAVVVCRCPWSLWLLRSLCGWSSSVVVCVDGGGEKSSHNQTLFVMDHK